MRSIILNFWGDCKRGGVCLGLGPCCTYKCNDSYEVGITSRSPRCPFERDICRALANNLDKVFMWTDSTIVLLWINSTNKHPIFIAHRVREILENTSVDQRNHIAIYDNPADAGTRGMSVEVLQFSSCVIGHDFLRTRQFPFVP